MARSAFASSPSAWALICVGLRPFQSSFRFSSWASSWIVWGLCARLFSVLHAHITTRRLRCIGRRFRALLSHLLCKLGSLGLLRGDRLWKRFFWTRGTGCISFYLRMCFHSTKRYKCRFTSYDWVAPTNFKHTQSASSTDQTYVAAWQLVSPTDKYHQ